MIRAALALLLSAAPALAAGQDPLAARRSQCLGWMMTAYPSGLEEISCTAEFDLPSPFLFKCARAQRAGFESEMQMRACESFFARSAAQVQSGYILR